MSFFFLKKKETITITRMNVYTITLYPYEPSLASVKLKKLNYVAYNRYTISTFRSMYKAEKRGYNEHNLELVQS